MILAAFEWIGSGPWSPFTTHPTDRPLVKVHPRAKKNATAGEVGGVLRVTLDRASVYGKANQACVEFFAKLFEGSAFVRYYCSRQDEPE
jgi:hypothetical protein